MYSARQRHVVRGALRPGGYRQLGMLQPHGREGWHAVVFVRARYLLEWLRCVSDMNFGGGGMGGRSRLGRWKTYLAAWGCKRLRACPFLKCLACGVGYS